MDELQRAADELEKATSELVKRAEELVRRSEELNRQLLRLAEVLANPNFIVTDNKSKPPILRPKGGTDAHKTFEETGILAEIKKFLDETGDQTRPSGEDPRD